MPPPPPNFLPAAAARRRNNRRPLDPTRHLQSRELWNKVRFHYDAASSADDVTDSDGNNTSSSWLLYYKALLQAILYEIQPFRIKPCYHRIMIFLTDKEHGLRNVLSTTGKNKAIHMLDSIQKLSCISYHLLRQYCTIQSIQQHKGIIGKASLVLFGLKLYHRTLLYLHELLHAGPILIIFTLLLLLYTIGLGEDTGAASGIPSAYSVFNRGMRRILGTVDAEDLARQYAGGAAVAAAMGGGVGGNNNNDERHRVNNGGGIWVHNDNYDSNGDDEDDEDRLRNERRRQRRLERLQRRNNQQDGTNYNNNDGIIDDDPMNGDAHEDDDDVDDRDENAQNNTPTQDNGNNASETNQGGARKSGKKARRRNLELRREMQRQRQAAAANGFGRGDGDDIVAIDLLIGDIAD